MNVLTFPGEKDVAYPFKKKLFLAAICLIPILFLILKFIDYSETKFVVAVLIPLIVVSLLSLETMLPLFIGSLYVFFYILGIHISIYLSFILFVSFIITQGRFEISTSYLPLPFLIYAISIIPSLFNSISIVSTLFFSLNLLGIFCISFIVHNYIRNFSDIKRVFSLVVIFSSINAIYAIGMGFLAGDRSWGFAGVVHVDYYNILAILFVAISILANGRRRIISILFFFLFFLAVILSQTRSLLLTFGISFLLLLTFLFSNHEKFGFKRIKIIQVFIVSVLLMFGVLFVAVQLNPDSFERIGELQTIESETIKTETDLGTNSFYSRLLLWHTAYKAFSAHPIVGIGAYSFPFTSQLYHELTPELFNELVRGLTPHLTFFAVLTETGIIGFMGFIFLICYLIRYGYRNIKRASNYEEAFYSMIVFFSQVYIVVAMFVTDAWLWGQCGILWGLVMGCQSGIYKIYNNKKEIPSSS